MSVLTRNRQHLLAAFLLGAVALLVFHKLTLHPSDLLVGPQDHGRSDVTKHSLPSRAFPWQAIREGELPYWHSNGLLGSPWLGNPQSALFYPPNWIFACGLDPTSTISWFIVLHHWFGGLGAYLLARHYRTSFVGAMLGGVVFLAAPFIVAQTGEGHSTQTCLIAWAPWGFLAYGRLRRGVAGSTALMTFVLVMTFFCGHVQECFFLVLLLSCFVAADLFVRSDKLLLSPRQLATRWLLVGLATAGVVAIELAPNWIYTKNAVRNGGMDVESASRISAGPLNLLQLIDPYVLGGPDDYAGPGEFFWETLCYFGIAPLLLSLVAVVFARRRRWVRRWSFVAIGALLFSLGADTPLFGLMHRFVPGMSMFRSPSRALFFCSLAVALLSAGGFDILAIAFRRRSQAGRLAWSATFCGLAAAGLSFAWFAHGRDFAIPGASSSWRSAVAALDGVAPSLWFAVTMLSAAALAWRPRWSMVAGSVISVCLLLDLGYFAHRALETVPVASLRKHNPIVELLEAEPSRGRVFIEQDLLSDREALISGVEKLRRYDPVPTARVGILNVALAPKLDPASEITGFNPIQPRRYRKPLLDMLNVTHLAITTDEPVELPGWELIAQGVMREELVLRGHPARHLPYAVYRNRSPMPRAYTVRSSRLIAIDRAATELASLDPRREVLSERDEARPEGAQAYQAADIVRRTPNSLTIHADVDEASWLVVAETFYPGWTAEIDGSPVPVEPANVALRGIRLPPGSHRVELRFFPPGLRIGGFVTCTALVLLLCGAYPHLKRRFAMRLVANPPGMRSLPALEPISSGGANT